MAYQISYPLKVTLPNDKGRHRERERETKEIIWSNGETAYDHALQM